MARLGFRVLGPLEVVRDDRPVKLGGERQHALLALLILRANEVVPSEQILEELFGKGVRDPANALQVAISRLRRTLGDGVLETRPRGYLLTETHRVRVASRGMRDACKMQLFRRGRAPREQPRRARLLDAEAKRVFLCIREPSVVLVARLPDLSPIAQWRLPSGGAHGLDIDHSRGRLYAACDDGALVEIDSTSGEVTNVWPIAGAPDVTFFNPSTGRIHVAIGDPGLVETIDPRTGAAIQTTTGIGAHTTALVVPDQLYVISPAHGGILVLADA